MFLLFGNRFTYVLMVLDPVSVHALLVAVPLRVTTWALHLQNTMDFTTESTLVVARVGFLRLFLCFHV